MKIFNFNFKNKNNKKENNSNYDLNSDKYSEIGKLIKEARLKKNLTVEELSNVSKIPESTINAIENNDIHLRPKYPFIRSILYKIEKCLSFKENSLLDLVTNDKNPYKKNKNNYLIRKFNFINSWQGSFFYFLFLILSLFILNRYFLPSINIIEIEIIENKLNEI